MITERQITRENMIELARDHTCECGGVLTVAWINGGWVLRCGNDRNHDGIKPVDTSAEDNEIRSKFKRRWKHLVSTIGKDKALTLRQYEGVLSLSEEQALRILDTLWGEAPIVEKTKAAMICHQYGLNPLMHHIFLVPFGQGEKRQWVTVIGIKATRLIASRQGKYSYLDATPRIMNEEEQLKAFGKVDNSRLWAITKLRDGTGNEATGYGFWAADVGVKGEDKGNSPFNMACIRSERNALDRLMPGVMPDIEVVDEAYEPPTALKREARNLDNIPTEVFIPDKPPAFKGKVPRDPSTLKNYGELCQFCYDEWKMMPRDILRECNASDSSEITDYPAAARKIAAARTA